MESTGVKLSIIHWNSPDKLETFDNDIVCLTHHNKVMMLKAREVGRDWNRLCEKYKIKYWCLLSELIHD